MKGRTFRYIIAVLIFVIYRIISHDLSRSDGDDSNEKFDYSSKELSECEEGRTLETQKIAWHDEAETECVVHSRKWKDYDRNRFCGKLAVSKDNYRRATAFKSKMSAGSYDWSAIYKELHEEEKDKVWRIKMMFDTLREKNHWSYREFLDVVVTFVQDIDYYLIYDWSCGPSDGDKCRGNERYGIMSPVEFMYTMEGDCDSRTLFLYTLLKHYKYDVAVLISEQYSHSVLGVNISSAGKFVYHSGRRYYVWETTAKGWELGQIPPDCPDMFYWKVAIN